LKQITSIQNPFIKSLVLLQEKAKTANKVLFLIEGKREISLAKRGYELESILFYPEICTEIEAKKSSTTELIEIKPYFKISLS
jgi:TrmH family RNA methyltransferase